MALPDKIYAHTLLVNNEEILPFGLKIKVGSGYHQEVIPITALTTSIQQITQVVYKITELKDLAMELVTDHEVEVRINWNKSIHYDDEEEKYLNDSL